MIKPSSKSHIRIISLILILLLITISIPSVLTISMHRRLTETTYNALGYINECTYTEVMLHFEALMEGARLSAQKAADEITDAILTTYPDNEDLREAFANLETSGLMDITEDILNNRYFNNVNTYDNDIFIANVKGILQDLNYDALPEDGHMIRSWEVEKDNNYNKELYDNSVKALINQSTNTLIVVEKVKHDNDNHVTYKTITRDTLEDIYFSEGIEGFKNYIFWVPAYIYDHKDILGVSDIINGVRVDNNKIIVVQEFNLYEQITINYSHLVHNEGLEHVGVLFSEAMRTFKLLCITCGLSGITFMIIACILYNRIMMIINDNEKEDSKGGE